MEQEIFFDENIDNYVGKFVMICIGENKAIPYIHGAFYGKVERYRDDVIGLSYPFSIKDNRIISKYSAFDEKDVFLIYSKEEDTKLLNEYLEKVKEFDDDYLASKARVYKEEPKNIQVCPICGDSIDEDDFDVTKEGKHKYCVQKCNAISNVENRKSVCVDLEKFSIYCEKGDYLEVTEWTNGEGVDIHIYEQRPKKEDNYSFTYDEIEAIMSAISRFNEIVKY